MNSELWNKTRSPFQLWLLLYCKVLFFVKYKIWTNKFCSISMFHSLNGISSKCFRLADIQLCSAADRATI